MSIMKIAPAVVTLGPSALHDRFEAVHDRLMIFPSGSMALRSPAGCIIYSVNLRDKRWPFSVIS